MAVPLLLREHRPQTCEAWVFDKESKTAKRCTGEIEFINSASGGFVCRECARKFHKRFFGRMPFEFEDAEDYLLRYPE